MSNYIDTMFHAPLGKRKFYSFPPYDLTFQVTHLYTCTHYYRIEDDYIKINQYKIKYFLFSTF